MKETIMFDSNTLEYIKKAEKAETSSAVKNYGAEYHSNHESYAVLKEEIDEVRDEEIKMKNEFFRTWDSIRTDNDFRFKRQVGNIKEHAEKLALEAVQVVAVCNKIMGADA